MNKYLSAAEKAADLLSGSFSDPQEVVNEVNKKIQYLQYYGNKYRTEIEFYRDVLWCLKGVGVTNISENCDKNE